MLFGVVLAFHLEQEVHVSFGNGAWIHKRGRIYVKSEANSEEETSSSSSESTTSGNASSFLSVLCPLLKLFSGGDPSQQSNHALEVATSSLASIARLLWGSRVSSMSTDVSSSPPLRLQLFEFEACPFCRREREAMTELHLSVEVYPCPKGSVRHRELVNSVNERFPFLIDPNTDTSMYESGDIVKYLFNQYGNGRGPSTGLLERLVQHLVHRMDANTSPSSIRGWCVKHSVPFLVDPNTGVQLGDYQKILAYLFKTILHQYLHSA
ncbi:hypothetical protein YC2023_018399 [Brassica napus]